MVASIDRDDLLRRVDLSAVLDALCGPRSAGGRWHCPDRAHADEHPSVTIRTNDHGTQTWRCWSGGHRGTAIDAVMASQRIGVHEAMVWLADNYGNLPVVDRPPSRPRRPPGDPDEHVVNYVRCAAKLLWTPAGVAQRDWLHDRGLGNEVLQANQIGADPGRRHLGRPRRGFPAGWPAVVYPARDRVGRPVFFQARYLDPPPHRGKYDSPSAMYAANPRLAWTTPIQPSDNAMVVVCEGIPDALIAAQAGLRAVAVLGTWAADQVAVAELADTATTTGCRLVVCFDGDEPGRTGADRFRRMLDDRAIDAGVVTPPDGHDLSSWAATDTDWFAALTASAPSRSIAVASPHDQRRLAGGLGIEMSLSLPGPH
jgi:DNA primase